MQAIGHFWRRETMVIRGTLILRNTHVGKLNVQHILVQDYLIAPEIMIAVFINVLPSF